MLLFIASDAKFSRPCLFKVLLTILIVFKVRGREESIHRLRASARLPNFLSLDAAQIVKVRGIEGSHHYACSVVFERTHLLPLLLLQL